jgi:membrane associated rhomboid family serine protease
MVLLRVHETNGRIEEWALVLASIGVSSRIEPGQTGFHLLVADMDYVRAQEALREFEKENQPVVETPSKEYGPSWLGWIVAAALLIIFLVLRGREAFASRGAADAREILAGQWWRAVTALTLHADLSHVLGNAAAAIVFIGPLARALGPGAAAWLLLVSAFLANLMTAVASGPGHVSIGASTALFAAIGALAALAFLQRRKQASRWRRPWLAIAAMLALVGLLGTAKGSDVIAHALGATFGLALGVVVARFPVGRSRIAQGAIALAAGATIALCWVRALH